MVQPHPFWDVPQRFQDMYLESLPLPDHMDAPSDLPDVAYYSCTAINGRSDFGGPSCNDTVLNPQGCSYVMPNESYAQSKGLARPSDAMVRKVRAGYAVSTTRRFAFSASAAVPSLPSGSQGWWQSMALQLISHRRVTTSENSSLIAVLCAARAG